jgi:hypothetical protein
VAAGVEAEADVTRDDLGVGLGQRRYPPQTVIFVKNIVDCAIFYPSLSM